jgi:flavin-dependent dehydrogenase
VYCSRLTSPIGEGLEWALFIEAVESGQLTASQVIIIGGGVSGCTCGLMLATVGFDVVTFEGYERKSMVCAQRVPAAARSILCRLQLWPNFNSGKPVPAYSTVSIWGSNDPVEAPSIFNPYGPGWHVDRPVFDDMLRNASIEAGVQSVHESAKLISKRSDGWLVSSGKKSVRAPFLIDATGRKSIIGRSLAIARHRSDRLMCLAAVIRKDARRDAGFDLVEAGPSGWWYSAPLPGCRRTVLYFTDPDLMRFGNLRSPKQWLAAIAQTQIVKTLVAEAIREESLSVPVAFCAETSWLETVCGADWCCVGDAAIAFDPLSSYGILAAMESAEACTDAVVRFFIEPQHSLHRYARWNEERRQKFIADKRRVYNVERRWRDKPFWRRRIG